MAQDERDFILQSARRVGWHENAPRPLDEAYCDMTHQELIDLAKTHQHMLRESEAARKEAEAARKEADRRYDLMLAQLSNLNENMRTLTDTLKERDCRIAEKDRMIEELRKMVQNLENKLSLGNRERFGSKSQKGPSKPKEKPGRTHQQDKDDFDGTPDSLGGDGPAPDSQAGEKAVGRKNRTASQLSADLMRKGSRYRTMKADNTVVHRFDPSRLPEGAVLIKTIRQYACEEVTAITEHEYELAVYRIGDTVVTAYLPAGGEPQVIDRLEGTHASADFMAHLAFNRFVLDTPLYREIQRIGDEGMRLSRKTLTNWLHKGSRYLSGMVEELKKTALEKDSIVNCDETWCRVRIGDRYRKRYVWCLVNREAGIVILYYEEGSRGRDVLLNIIGDAEIKALQSDGYNVYLYVDRQLSEVDHLCCMAHARAKFRQACETAGDPDAEYMLGCFAELYRREALFRDTGLPPEEIGKARKSPQYLDVIGRIRSKLNALTSDGHPPRGELMEKAVRYLDTFWEQLFRYTDNGRYSIDNNIAERNIRPLAGERKNSLFFGSHRMAEASAAYHTAIATCRMAGVSVLEYFKKFFRRVIEGERDYSLLMPRTIGINAKNF